MTEAAVAERAGRTNDERAYYALNARAWPLFAPFYDLMVAPFRKIRPEVVTLAGVGSGSRVLDVAPAQDRLDGPVIVRRVHVEAGLVRVHVVETDEVIANDVLEHRCRRSRGTAEI